MRFTVAVLISSAWLAPAFGAATVSGDVVYKQRCASCHDSGDAKVPNKDALRQLSVARIRRSMEFGVMANVATPLVREERDAVSNYLGVASSSVTERTEAFCSDRVIKIDDHARSG